MIPPTRDDCGYDGLECTGVGTLSAAYRGTKMVADDVFGRIADFEPDWDDPALSDIPENQRWNWIDNYLNLPTSVPGETAEASYLLDMSLPSGSPFLPLAEVACLEDYDPFSETSFVDAFGRYESAGTPIVVPVVYTYEDGQDQSSPETLRILVPVASSNIHFDELDVEIADVQPVRATYETMSIATVSAPRAVRFNPLQLKFSDMMNNTLDSLSIMAQAVWGLRKMMVAMAHATCDQFRIYLHSGFPYTRTGRQLTAKYKCSGGTAHINGKAVSVAAYSGTFDPGTHMYANFTLTNANASGEYTSCSGVLSTSSGGDFSVGIGYVYVAEIAPDPVIAAGLAEDQVPAVNRMAVVVQETCTVTANVVKTSKEGLLYVKGGSRYQVVETAPCDDQNQQ